MSAELYGPQPGNTVLLVISEREMGELLRLILERRKLHLTVASTIVEATSKLSEAFDLIWLCLPLPDFHAHLFLDLVLAQPDLAPRVGIEDPIQVIKRIQKEWPDFFPQLSTPEDYTSRKQNEKWVWIRMGDESNRKWIKHVLEQCKRRKPEGREQ